MKLAGCYRFFQGDQVFGLRIPDFGAGAQAEFVRTSPGRSCFRLRPEATCSKHSLRIFKENRR